MSGSDHKQQKQVTLEQLLQLKRSERPAPEFWDEFDRELHRRQLAALVTVRPWYVRSLDVGLRLMRRTALPATAALGLLAAYLAMQPTQPTENVAAQVAAAPRTGEEEPRALMLPEEHFSSNAARPSTTIEISRAVTAPAAESRYLMQEFAAAALSSRAFVTQSLPQTLSAATGQVASIEIDSLAVAPVRRLAPAEPESF